MNGYLLFIFAVLIGGFLLEATAALLTLRSLDPILPEEFQGRSDPERYARAQDYVRATTRLALARETTTTLLTLLFLLLGGFNRADVLARSFDLGTIPTGLFFTGLLLLLAGLVNLPFSLFSTFSIEERFGFNRTTVRTYVLDLAKGLLLAVLIGAPLLALVFWLFEHLGPQAWLYCWLFVVGWSMLLQFLAPLLIMPLFNTFTPLADGELKERILSYVRGQRFQAQGIFTMDGSKRSTRANAFFTGFGRSRRIVFFDTLLAQLAPGEIVAVLAHEIGHYRRRHLFLMLAWGVIETGIMLALLAQFLNNPGLFAAFGMAHPSVYASLVFFGFLSAPLSLLLGILGKALSRRHEYQADTFAATSTGRPQDLLSALQKLSVANMANLTPHPLHVLLHAAHPPVLARIRALAALCPHDPPDDEEACTQCRRPMVAARLAQTEHGGPLCPDCLAELESCGCADD